jgi:hypothetical protein
MRNNADTDSRLALRRVNFIEETRLHIDRHFHAGARHRRENGHFTIVNAVLLRPLPYPESERLMEMERSWTGDESVNSLSAPKFIFLRDNFQSFEAVTATQGMGAKVDRKRDRSVDVHRDCADARADCPAGLLDTRAAGGESGSDDRAPV